MALNVTDNAKKGNNNKETVRVSAMIRPPPANNGGATQLRRSAIGLLHRNTLKRGQMQNQERKKKKKGNLDILAKPQWELRTPYL